MGSSIFKLTFVLIYAQASEKLHRMDLLGTTLFHKATVIDAVETTLLGPCLITQGRP